jgi:hypothetical protein
MIITHKVRFVLGIFDIVAGIVLIVVCIALERYGKVVFTLTPIFCGIYCLTNSFETKKQRQKHTKEMKRNFGGTEND